MTVRWADFRAVAEAEAFRDAIRLATQKVRPSVLCADWRSGTIMPPPVTEVLVKMFVNVNPALRCAAILLPSASPTFAMQAERMVREAGNPMRRTFREPAEHLAWFATLASPDELEVARRFMSEG